MLTGFLVDAHGLLPRLLRVGAPRGGSNAHSVPQRLGIRLHGRIRARRKQEHQQRQRADRGQHRAALRNGGPARQRQGERREQQQGLPERRREAEIRLGKRKYEKERRRAQT